MEEYDMENPPIQRKLVFNLPSKITNEISKQISRTIEFELNNDDPPDEITVKIQQPHDKYPSLGSNVTLPSKLQKKYFVYTQTKK